jgi:hypothetical protein
MAMSTSVLALTIVMFGAGGFLMGQVVADTWRPWWQILPYGALLAIANQFLGFALFSGPFIVDNLVSTGSQPIGSAVFEYLVEFAVIVAFALVAFRITRVRRMTTQYPWLYERAGLFAWRQKNP